MRLTSRLTVAASALLLAGTLTGCGGNDDEHQAGSAHESETESETEAEGGAAADVTTCHADATAAPTPYGEGFPADFPFPPKTTVFHVEDRGNDGTIATAVSASDLRTVLAFMNDKVVGAGFETTEGETEEHDAEASWTGNGFRGRWAIRDSSNCPGETVIQVLAAPD